jgi:hypothetical protein
MSEFETKKPGSASIWTVNTLNTDSQANSDLFKDIEDIGNLPEITTIEELMAYVQENIIRFDTNPRNYKKDDYKSLLKMVNRAMFYIYRRDPEITKILNGVYYIGVASLLTDPLSDKAERGYNNNGIYSVSTAGTYVNFGVSVTEHEAKRCVTLLVPVFGNGEIGGQYSKVVYELPDFTTVSGERKADMFSFKIDNPVPSLLAGQVAWNTDEGTLVLGMNGGEVEQSIGFELYYHVQSTQYIANGDLLMSVGTHGNSGKILVARATPGIDPKYIIGIATEDIPLNGNGFATWFGKLKGINTTGSTVGESWVNGTILYQHPTIEGKFTSIKPSIGNKLPIAIVISSNVNGYIFARMERSVSINDINDINVVNPTDSQPLVYDQSIGGFTNKSNIKLNSITPTESFFLISGALSALDGISTDGRLYVEQNIEVNGQIESGGRIATSEGFKIYGKTENDFVMADNNTISLSDLRTGTYRLYNPSDNTQVVLSINEAGQVLIEGDIVQNGAAYNTHAENISTPQELIMLRFGAEVGIPLGALSGFVIEKYNGVNDGYIAIDSTGTLRIGDVTDLQPVLTREELDDATAYSPLFLNKNTYRAETLHPSTTKDDVIDSDSLTIKDSEDFNKPKWVSFLKIKTAVKNYLDNIYVSINGNQTINNIKTFTSSPIVPNPINPTDAANRQFVTGAVDAALMDGVEQVRSQATDKVPSSKVLDDELNKKQDVLPAEVIEWQLAYGIEVKTEDSTTAQLRVGNINLHKEKPIHTKMRGCLIKQNGDFNYYLDADDWLKKEDQTTSNLTGADGNVMIEVPEFYIKYEYRTPTDYRVMISEYPISGYNKVEKFYVGAYKASLNRPENKLASVRNFSAGYRGGNNNAAYDETDKELLGKPVTGISLNNFRIAARNNKPTTSEWNVLPYEQRKVLQWLYYIEFANLNSQLSVQAPIDGLVIGGGLSAGVTNADLSEWTAFNDTNPFINCGTTNSFGNRTGVTAVTVQNFGGGGQNRVFNTIRWRGIEDIFGHIWEHGDGCLVDIKTDGDGGTSTVFVAKEPAKFANTLTSDYQFVGGLVRGSQFIRTMLLGANGEVIPTVVSGAGSGNNGFWCDFHYTSINVSSLRTMLWGGAAANSSGAGIACSYSTYAPTTGLNLIGTRLCFIPNA